MYFPHKLIYLTTNLGGNSSPIVPLMFLPLVIIIFFSIIVNYLIFSQIMVYLSNGFQNDPNEWFFFHALFKIYIYTQISI